MVAGNIDGDSGNKVNLADVIRLAQYVKARGKGVEIYTTGNVDGDSGSKINLADVIRLAQYVKARGKGVEINY